ncbi:hypothetical protein [Lacisediminihabitans changchengi]|uniref:Uncharacterized protein n=1 Tax=Lacisediminihabitans changchengi TaxID=2787634 RepID=A0A934W4A3_9MICO|nr:hypothetical protein [Lacisediminihabitans changchengi]MBK4347295.1 hypothetical protein [Lacisediminihabitans changchengi]
MTEETALRIPRVTASAPGTGSTPAVTETVTDTSAPVSPTPSTSSWRSVFYSLPAERWIGSSIRAVVAYAAVWGVALLVSLLLLLSLHDVTVDWSLLFLLPAQIVGLGLGGVFTASTSVLGVTATVSLLWAPLLVSAAAIVGLALASRHDERAHPVVSHRQRLLLSALTGVVFTVIAVLAAALLRPSYSLSNRELPSGFPRLGDGVLEASGSAASVSLVVISLIVGVGVSFLSRWREAHRGDVRELAPRPPLVTALLSAIPVSVLYAVVVAIIVSVAAVISVAVNGGGSALIASPLWLPTVALNGLALVNFSVLGVSGPLTGYPGFSALATSVSLPGSMPWWVLVIAIVLNLSIVVAVATVLRLRRASTGATVTINWFSTAVVFAAVGSVVSLLGSILLWSHVDTSAISGQDSGLLGAGALLASSVASTWASVGPAGWTIFVFVLLGVVVEVAAIWVAPVVISLVKPAALDRANRFLTRVGVPLAPAGQVVPGVAAVSELSPERRRRAIIIGSSVGGVVAVVVLAAVAISVVNATVFSPQRQVEAYLSALESGHAKDALALGHVDVGEAGLELLTDRALAATSTRITGHTALSGTITGDNAYVSTRAEQSGTSIPVSYSLHRTGKTWLFFDTWALNPVELPTLDIVVPQGAEKVTVNGVSVPVEAARKDGEGTRLAVFPGRYSVQMGGDTTWVTAAPQKKLITPASVAGESVELTLEPTAAFHKEIDSQMGTFLAGCVASHEIEPSGCPFRYYSYGDTSNVVWSLKSPPAYSLIQDFNGGWAIETKEAGEADVTYTSSFFGSSYDEDGSSSVYVDGGIAFTGGKPVYSYGSDD